ncbi:hypothetical protein DFO70_107172 [Cytobacillus firmus]|uniref:Uncharacterized protein n=2 Tax=Cytobacillus TaxID=2675230 RepID=A0A366JTE8_CYTFI|nr:hypothetical protein DFO70_107172 [Cytobacillus firmus]TDX42074.1 hypothetical protein DFO72_107238 [Cytobacillus oceanisediminis]
MNCVEYDTHFAVLRAVRLSLLELEESKGNKREANSP